MKTINSSPIYLLLICALTSCARITDRQDPGIPVEEIHKIVILDTLWTLSVAAPFKMEFTLQKSDQGMSGIAKLTVREGEKPEYESIYDLHVPSDIVAKFESKIANLKFTENQITSTEYSYADYYPSREIYFHSTDGVFTLLSYSNFP